MAAVSFNRPRRVAKLVPNGENWDRTDYYWNEAWQCLEERSETVAGETTPADEDHVKVQYVWDIRYIDAPVLRWRDENDDGDFLDANETLYYCQDANFNVTALVNTSGTVVERYVYDPYGKVTIYDDDWSDTRTSSSYANEILFAGYRYDSESGLYPVRHRAYHPTLGRWLQRDPIGYADGMGLYTYGQDSPATGRDPLGLGWREDWGLAARLGGAYLYRASPQRGGYVGNLLFDWALGSWDVDDLATARGPAALSQNAEITSVVKAEMRAYAKRICQDGRDIEYPRFTYSDQFQFRNQPLSGVLGTGTLSADGSGSVIRDPRCSRTCRRAVVDADWRYKDNIDFLSYGELYDRGYIRPPWESVWNPLAALANLEAAAEGLLDIGYDKILDANYPFDVQWYETLGGCCEQFDGQ